MPSRSPWLATLTALIVAMHVLGTVACDDPVPGTIGGLILTIRSFEATGDPDLKAIKTIEIQTARVEVQHQKTLGGDPSFLLVDSQPRTIIIQNNGQADLLVAQYQVPEGFVSQVRIYPRAVTLHLKNGTDIALGVPSPNLPSWEQSGWKIEPVDGTPWPILQDELTGVRAHFYFDSQMIYNKGHGYKIKPTVAAERFIVNPVDDGPGIYADRLLIIFKNGITKSQIDQINGSINARILATPTIGTAYRIKIPPTINLQDGIRYYKSRGEVHAVVPAMNYGIFGSPPNDPFENAVQNPNHDACAFPDAWSSLQSYGNSLVGATDVRVAILDTGFSLAHPDLYLNIYINPGEIPHAVKLELKNIGIDPEHVTFYELNDPANKMKIWQFTTDINHNGRVDGEDLLASWSDQENNDHKGPTDDLVGYDFADTDNDPRDSTNNGHGMNVAGIVGAIGNNALNVAGGIWRVSIIPIRVATDSSYHANEISKLEHAPDYVAIQGMEYAELMNAQVVNMSFGFGVTTKSANISCITRKDQVQKGVPNEEFATASGDYRAAFQRTPFVDAELQPKTQALYIIASGNSNLELSRKSLLDVTVFPGVPIKQAFGNHALLVGEANGSNSMPFQKAGGSSHGDFIDIWAPGSGWKTLNLGPATESDQQSCGLAIPAEGLACPSGGTSFAAPAVAAVAALIQAKQRSLGATFRSPSELHDILISTAERDATVQINAGCPGISSTNLPRLHAGRAVKF